MVWQMPASGTASLTHYDLPVNFLASCGCSYGATYHPTAALSSLAYSGTLGSTIGPGPGCGRCFNLTLLAAHEASPPFVIPDPSSTADHAPKPSVVVKVVDKCPSPAYCAATHTRPNSIGQMIHFDLALPSPALNLSFFPSDPDLYGYADFGVWNIAYEAISCQHWSGWTNASTLGVEESYPGYEQSCCPGNPAFTNESCPQASPAPARRKKNSGPGRARPTRTVLLIIVSLFTYTLSR